MGWQRPGATHRCRENTRRGHQWPVSAHPHVVLSLRVRFRRNWGQSPRGSSKKFDSDADQVLVGLRGGARFTVPTGMEAALSRVVTVNGREQASRGAPATLAYGAVRAQWVVICMRVHGCVCRARFITATCLAGALGM